MPAFSLRLTPAPKIIRRASSCADEFAEGHFLTRNMMKWFWDSYTTDLN
jgi:hypothetical protein